MKRVRCRTPKSRLSKNRSARPGFTLMEVLLVLAILGVIIALVAPNLIGQQKQANVRAARVQVQGVEQACDIYAVDHNGEFPQSLDSLIANPGSDTNWKGPYFKNSTTIPADPWGNPIQYQYPGQNQGAGVDRPDIWSLGPDKQSNTGDDVTNWTKAT